VGADANILDSLSGLFGKPKGGNDAG
jgi:hypothetical protein